MSLNFNNFHSLPLLLLQSQGLSVEVVVVAKRCFSIDINKRSEARRIVGMLLFGFRYCKRSSHSITWLFYRFIEENIQNKYIKNICP